MAELTDIAIRLVRLYGPIALLCFTFLETSMLFPFLPSEVVVPVAAAVLVTDLPSFLVFVSAATVGGTVGAFVPFYVFRDARGGWSERIRRRIHVSDDRAERGGEWFRRWGRSSVLWGRFLPALRSVVSIPAGIAEMDSTRFGAYTAVGSVGFYAATAAVVYYGRQRSLFSATLSAVSERPGMAVVALLALVGVGLLVRRWSRGRSV